MVIKRLLFSAAMVFLLLLPPLLPQALACGHEGVYFGGGYTQLFMYSPGDLQTGNLGQKVHMSPGYGANAVVGYDFCGTRFGIQMPFEFTMQRLNRQEWVPQIGSTLEGVLHLAEWSNGIDIHLVGGVGWSYLFEGEIQNHSRGAAITGDFGPGLSYYFFRNNKVSTALTAEAPFRIQYYFGDHLSPNGTTFVSFPIRLSIQVGF